MMRHVGWLKIRTQNVKSNIKNKLLFILYNTFQNVYYNLFSINYSFE